MEYRNAQFNRHGTIDVEIKHPKYGWIPFTASPDDVEDFGKAIHAEVSKGDVAKYVAPPLLPREPTRTELLVARIEKLESTLSRLEKAT